MEQRQVWEFTYRECNLQWRGLEQHLKYEKILIYDKWEGWHYIITAIHEVKVDDFHLPHVFRKPLKADCLSPISKCRKPSALISNVHHCSIAGNTPVLLSSYWLAQVGYNECTSASVKMKRTYLLETQNRKRRNKGSRIMVSSKDDDNLRWQL